MRRVSDTDTSPFLSIRVTLGRSVDDGDKFLVNFGELNNAPAAAPQPNYVSTGQALGSQAVAPGADAGERAA